MVKALTFEHYKTLQVFSNGSECRLGLVYDYLFSGAITVSEFKLWCTKIIEQETDIHWLFFDLLDIDPRDLKYFTDNNLRAPYINLSMSQSNAVPGVRHYRDLSRNPDQTYEDTIEVLQKTSEALNKHPEVLECFKFEFEFLNV